MRLSVLSVLPEILEAGLNQRLLRRAQERSLIRLENLSLRDFAEPPHYRVDERPFGGGAGMLLSCAPIVKALSSIDPDWKAHRVLLSAKGEAFTQKRAKELSACPHLILICGRYEGVDDRIAQHYVDEEIRVGDLVSMGGEFAAGHLAESVLRLVPGVLGNEGSLVEESFDAQDQLEYPQYTRPRSFEGLEVPDELYSGNHQEVERWKRQHRSSKKTFI